MESKTTTNNNSKEKKNKRKEKLEKQKLIHQIIKAASAPDIDYLSFFHPFRQFNRNGLSVYLDSGRGDNLPSPTKQYIQNLLKLNMEGPFGSEWAVEEKVKRREMVVPDARYIFVHERITSVDGETSHCKEKTGPMVGFVHYRFTVEEEEVPVLYVYEIQLESRVHGKGLGKFLMQLLELIARKSGMSAVVLTVQKANVSAMNFYTTKLRYLISSISPSRVNPLTKAEASYEILCKTFDDEAKTALEVKLKLPLQIFGMPQASITGMLFLSFSISFSLRDSF
ncbi:hypothetical protein ACFE04_024176 [Oxalis oulophora]